MATDEDPSARPVGHSQSGVAGSSEGGPTASMTGVEDVEGRRADKERTGFVSSSIGAVGMFSKRSLDKFGSSLKSVKEKLKLSNDNAREKKLLRAAGLVKVTPRIIIIHPSQAKLLAAAFDGSASNRYSKTNGESVLKTASAFLSDSYGDRLSVFDFGFQNSGFDTQKVSLDPFFNAIISFRTQEILDLPSMNSIMKASETVAQYLQGGNDRVALLISPSQSHFAVYLACIVIRCFRLERRWKALSVHKEQDKGRSKSRRRSRKAASERDLTVAQTETSNRGSSGSHASNLERLSESDRRSTAERSENYEFEEFDHDFEDKKAVGVAIVQWYWDLVAESKTNILQSISQFFLPKSSFVGGASSSSSVSGGATSSSSSSKLSQAFGFPNIEVEGLSTEARNLIFMFATLLDRREERIQRKREIRRKEMERQRRPPPFSVRTESDGSASVVYDAALDGEEKGEEYVDLCPPAEQKPMRKYNENTLSPTSERSDADSFTPGREGSFASASDKVWLSENGSLTGASSERSSELGEKLSESFTNNWEELCGNFPLLLTSVIINGLPMLKDKDGSYHCRPYLMISDDHGGIVYSSMTSGVKRVINPTSPFILYANRPVCGEFIVKLYHLPTNGAGQKLFSCRLHSGLIKPVDEGTYYEGKDQQIIARLQIAEMHDLSAEAHLLDCSEIELYFLSARDNSVPETPAEPPSAFQEQEGRSAHSTRSESRPRETGTSRPSEAEEVDIVASMFPHLSREYIFTLVVRARENDRPLDRVVEDLFSSMETQEQEERMMREEHQESSGRNRSGEGAHPTHTIENHQAPQGEEEEKVEEDRDNGGGEGASMGTSEAPLTSERANIQMSRRRGRNNPERGGEAGGGGADWHRPAFPDRLPSVGSEVETAFGRGIVIAIHEPVDLRSECEEARLGAVEPASPPGESEEEDGGGGRRGERGTTGRQTETRDRQNDLGTESKVGDGGEKVEHSVQPSLAEASQSIRGTTVRGGGAVGAAKVHAEEAESHSRTDAEPCGIHFESTIEEATGPSERSDSLKKDTMDSSCRPNLLGSLKSNKSDASGPLGLSDSRNKDTFGSSDPSRPSDLLIKDKFDSSRSDSHFSSSSAEAHASSEGGADADGASPRSPVPSRHVARRADDSKVLYIVDLPARRVTVTLGDILRVARAASSSGEGEQEAREVAGDDEIYRSKHNINDSANDSASGVGSDRDSSETSVAARPMSDEEYARQLQEQFDREAMEVQRLVDSIQRKEKKLKNELHARERKEWLG